MPICCACYKQRPVQLPFVLSIGEDGLQAGDSVKDGDNGLRTRLSAEGNLNR